jgi:cardiolipin synthase
MAELTARHQLRLFQGGDAYFQALLAAMDAATREIRLETYLFDFHGVGARVADALAQAALRGVNVCVVVDGVGTGTVPAHWAQGWQASGVKWRVFAPLGRLGLLLPAQWRRLHRKLCVVDGQVAFCGGINVLDDHFDPHRGWLPAPRLDFAVSLQGPVVAQMHATMARFWWRLQAAAKVQQADWAGAWAALQQLPAAPWRSPWPSTTFEPAQVRLLLRDNLAHRSDIERAYRRAIGAARHDIVMAHAYFLPSRKVFKGLRLAVARGVRVRLLLQGRYENFFQFHAVAALYARLLQAGIEVYTYQPSFLHAKVAVVDGRWATVGSSNMDPLSVLLAREANVVIEDAAFAQDLHVRLAQVMQNQAVRLSPQTYARRGWLQRTLDQLALALVRLSLVLTGKRY